MGNAFFNLVINKVNDYQFTGQNWNECFLVVEKDGKYEVFSLFRYALYKSHPNQSYSNKRNGKDVTAESKNKRAMRKLTVLNI